MKNKKKKGIGLWVKIGLGLAVLLLIVLFIWLRIWPWVLGILGGVLLLLLCLLIIILLVPVRYKGKVEQEGMLKARVAVSWLFPLVCFDGRYDGSGFVWKLRILGICIKTSEKDEQKKVKKTIAPSTNEGVSDDKQEKESIAPPAEEKELESEAGKRVSGCPLASDEAKKKAKNKKAKIPFRECCETMKGYWRMAQENVRVVKKIFHYLGRFLKSLWPRKCKVWLRFGLSDPSATGQILGAYWAVWPLVGKRKRCELHVEPDFENAVFACEGWLCGWFNLGGLLWPVMLAILDKDIQKTIKDFFKSK